MPASPCTVTRCGCASRTTRAQTSPSSASSPSRPIRGAAPNGLASGTGAAASASHAGKGRSVPFASTGGRGR